MSSGIETTPDVDQAGRAGHSEAAQAREESLCCPVQHDPRRLFAEILRVLRRGVEVLARDEAPWRTVEGIELRSVTVAAHMCRSLVSVGRDGRLYDCDFNQMPEIPLGASARQPRTAWTLDSLEALEGARVATADHCCGCTAGAGSSCGGALQ